MHSAHMADLPFFPRVGVLAVVQHNGNFLLVKRAKAPDAGLWGFPGGRVEPGETLHTAAPRELQEETGLKATATHVIDTFDSLHYDVQGNLIFHYVIVALNCTLTTQAHCTPIANDDALEARWFSYDEICALGAHACTRLQELAQMARHSSVPDLKTHS